MNDKNKAVMWLVIGVVVICAILGGIIHMNNTHGSGQTQEQPPQPQPAPAENK